MKLAQKSLIRMKSILKQDKEQLSQPFLNMIKNDIANIVNSYLDFKDNIAIKYFVDEDGFYDFQINIKANRLKKVNFYNT
ncbi:MAG: cell division topological specificity factor MinE [Clostridia bacterium]|nr:cell division topological specificity factor MinE [Clostridia bacterium]